MSIGMWCCDGIFIASYQAPYHAKRGGGYDDLMWRVSLPGCFINCSVFIVDRNLNDDGNMMFERVQWHGLALCQVLTLRNGPTK